MRRHDFRELAPTGFPFYRYPGAGVPKPLTPLERVVMLLRVHWGLLWLCAERRKALWLAGALSCAKWPCSVLDLRKGWRFLRAYREYDAGGSAYHS